MRRHGRIDLLVNKRGLRCCPCRSRRELARSGPVDLRNELLPACPDDARLRATHATQGSGRIINIGSVLGFLPMPYEALYAATKHAVEGYSERSTTSSARRGIRVSVIEPAYTKTPFDANFMEPDAKIDEYREARAGMSKRVSELMATAELPGVVADAVLKAAERADIDPGDVRMPARPVEPPSLDVYKREAEQSVARTGAIGADHRYLGQIDVDPNLVIYRHNERARERAAVASLQGAVWTLDLVAARIVEAFTVVLRMPEQHRPRGYGSAMPQPVTEMADMVARAENGSLQGIRASLRRRCGVATQAELPNERSACMACRVPVPPAGPRGAAVCKSRWDGQSNGSAHFHDVQRAWRLAGHFLQKTAPRIGIDRQRARGQRPSADVMPSE
jgi:hypothetical protein